MNDALVHLSIFNPSPVLVRQFRGVPWDAVAAHPGTSPAKEGTTMSKLAGVFIESPDGGL
jgi:hypothetical protein